jgi:tetratricopeptide (TPR) repeat protein
MDDNESILAELRKISAWAESQRRMTKWSLVIVVVVMAVTLAFAVLWELHEKTSLEATTALPKAEDMTWGDVDSNVRRANPDEAIRIGEELIQKMPNYAEGHRRLASAYLAAGKVEQAREHFVQAFHLFPSEENEKLLAAIEKRIKEGTAQLTKEKRRALVSPRDR